ncbi:MAG TPA: hypothetical protein VE132_08680 [Micromonosporaceae bacterium]|nr:hypothetical protein [Micromonosporaceae bacterium]
MSTDEPHPSPAVDPYDDDVGALVVMYAEHVAMLGRFSALSAETDRIQRELATLRAELDAARRPANTPTLGPRSMRTDQLLDRLMTVVHAGDAEMDVYVNEMLPGLHTLLARIQRR